MGGSPPPQRRRAAAAQPVARTPSAGNRLLVAARLERAEPGAARQRWRVQTPPGSEERGAPSQRPDEEAVVDQGGTSTILNIHYEKEELEGHRTLYVGVRMPLGRQSHRHHRTHGQKHRRRGRGKGAGQGEEGPEALAHGITLGREDTPSQRVQFILGTEEDEEHVPHELFTELDEICMKEGEDAEWKETARWLKFEEDVEDGGERWSKPYVATLSLHSLFELRSCLINGTVLLDMRANSIEEISDLVLDQQELFSDLSDSMRVKVREALLKKHHHQNEKKRSNLIPIVRSFAEVGKKQSDPHSMDKNGQTVSPQSVPTTNLEVKNGVNCEHSPVDLSKVDLHFMKKIPTGAEASNVLVGEVDTLDRPIVAFVRLSPAVLLSGLTEVPIPTRFLFILLGPVGKGQQYHEIGRSMATIMTDEIFHDVAYKAKDRDDLLAGIDEFLDQVTVLPPGEWDPSIRIEPPKNVPSQEKRKMPGVPNGNVCHIEPEPHGGHSGPELQRTGRLFGGLVLDIKRKAPWYWSDYQDALSLQCLASFLFLYCACMSPVITFGGLLGEATEGRISAIESLFGASMTGIAYSLFAGQALTILGSTGPVLVFEKILFKFCKDYALSYLSLRACIGLWTAFLCIVLVATDASSLVCYITRFTEEAFASLICIIFIYEAIEKLIHLAETYPIHMHSQLDHLSLYYCRCTVPENPNNHTLQYWKDQNIVTTEVHWANLTVTECQEMHGEFTGPACGHHGPYTPDVLFWSCILFFTTFILSSTLKTFKTSRYFPTRVRSMVSDFAVFLTIFTMVIIDFLIGVPSPKLQVPSVFKFIPMPVLYGVFLYMGVSSLQGIQFFDRLKLFGMPAKHQPDFIYLRHVPLRKVHLFTLIQLTCLVLLWVIKASPAAIVFPMMVLALVFVRKVMDLCFSKRELSWLDDLMPESKKKKLDDAKQKAKEEEEAEKMIEMERDKFPLESRKLLSSTGKNNSFRCDPSEINISDEMPKTTVWKALSMNPGNTKEKSLFN
ncbi:electroneutral sodium bicarbonate exchanger 1 isoform X5 [Myotis myotis]|uniref:electroneutral sodium bicarbonate exchanger 1 isoform X5 n=1 Tax=Myotis myotis TaxID=51298 RepID=UPI0017495767|nr:electroneutral sodium bicarbonate exchanger 1 isoform X5 [Myotis myotis]